MWIFQYRIRMLYGISIVLTNMYLNNEHMPYSSCMHIIKCDWKTCKADDSVILQGLMLDKLLVERIVNKSTQMTFCH